MTEPIDYVSAYPTFPPPFPAECQVPSFFDGTSEEYITSTLYKTGPWVSINGVLFDRNGPATPNVVKLRSNSLYGKDEPTQIAGSVLSSLPPEPVMEDTLQSVETEFTQSWDSINAPDTFGVRIIFNSETNPERTIVKFAPILFDTEEEATDLLFKLTAPNGIRQLLGWAFLGWRLPDNDNWVPLGMRVSKLSETPF